jgi:hypothetical protein
MSGRDEIQQPPSAPAHQVPKTQRELVKLSLLLCPAQERVGD